MQARDLKTKCQGCGTKHKVTDLVKQSDKDSSDKLRCPVCGRRIGRVIG